MASKYRPSPAFNIEVIKINSIWKAILDILNESTANIAACIKKRNYKQALRLSLPFIVFAVCVIGLCVLLLIWLYRSRNAIFAAVSLPLLIVLAIASYRANHKPEVTDKPDPKDYVLIEGVIKRAARGVGPALGLATLYDYSDITVSPDKRMIPRGKYWVFAYRLPKRDATKAMEDTETICRILQKEVEFVLENTRPAGFAKTSETYEWGEESIIQVDEVIDADAYLIVYCAVADKIYFDERRKRKESQVMPVDASDEDF